jgi:hypothetical protein
MEARKGKGKGAQRAAGRGQVAGGRGIGPGGLSLPTVEEAEHVVGLWQCARVFCQLQCNFGWASSWCALGLASFVQKETEVLTNCEYRMRFLGFTDLANYVAAVADEKAEAAAEEAEAAAWAEEEAEAEAQVEAEAAAQTEEEAEAEAQAEAAARAEEVAVYVAKLEAEAKARGVQKTLLQWGLNLQAVQLRLADLACLLFDAVSARAEEAAARAEEEAGARAEEAAARAEEGAGARPWQGPG